MSPGLEGAYVNFWASVKDGNTLLYVLKVCMRLVLDYESKFSLFLLKHKIIYLELLLA